MFLFSEVGITDQENSTKQWMTILYFPVFVGEKRFFNNAGFISFCPQSLLINHKSLIDFWITLFYIYLENTWG